MSSRDAGFREVGKSGLPPESRLGNFFCTCKALDSARFCTSLEHARTALYPCATPCVRAITEDIPVDERYSCECGFHIPFRVLQIDDPLFTFRIDTYQIDSEYCRIHSPFRTDDRFCRRFSGGTRHAHDGCSHSEISDQEIFFSCGMQ